MPAGTSAWQYKSGACPSAEALARDEFTKPEVQAAVGRGEAYCFLTADSVTARKKGEIREAIDNLYREHGRSPRGEVYSADDLARWAQQHLGPAATYLRVPVVGWARYDQWRKNRNFRNEFFPDGARADLIKEIRRRVRERGKQITVLGRAGMGKTRAVLEAVGADGIRQRVLYLADAANLDPEFFWFLNNEVPESAAVLVIDECTPAEYRRVKELTDGLPPGVAVVLVGPNEHDAIGDYELGGLPVEELAKVVGDFAGEMPEPQREAIAARCGGSPKLVAYVSEEIARRGGEVAWDELERVQDVANFVNERLFPVGGSDVSSKVMRALCLFTRLGWRDEVEPEGRAATGFFGVDWTEAKLAAEELVRRGVVSRRGRYLYPTPDILANSLTRNTVRSLGGPALGELFGVMNEEAQRSMAERLRQLGDEPGTRESVIEIVGDPYFFSSPQDLNDPARAHFLRLLAPVFPQTALDALDKTIGAASREELVRLDSGGRRELVWMLEELAWWEEHFDRAARLLLRLAWAENETYANNATGIWSRLFQVWLGGTAAPYNRRLTLLRETLQDTDPAIRKLGINALGSALQTRNMSRVGGPPEDTGQLPPREWRPRDNTEWGEILLTCLDELERMLDDPDGSVRAEALSVIGDRGSDLIHSGLLNRWAPLARRLLEEPFEVRKRLLDVVEWQLRHGNPTDEERVILEELERELSGSSFSDRLRRVVGAWDYELELAGLGDGQEAIRELAAYSLENIPELEAELPWLQSGEANSGFSFGKELGVKDEASVLLPILLRYWENGISDDRFVTGYLAGAKEQRGTEWLEQSLDSWASDPEKSLLVATATWRVLPTPRAARRLVRLIEGGSLAPSFLGHLVWGFWARDLPPDEVGELVAAASEDKSRPAVFARLAFLEQYIMQKPEALGELRAAADLTLRESASHAFGTMDGHRWHRLAEVALADNPVEMARLGVFLAQKAAQGTGRVDGEASQLVSTAITKTDIDGQAEILEEVLGPALESTPGLMWVLESPFERDLLDRLDPELVANWVERDVEARLRLVVYAVAVGGQPLAGLARSLLVRFGDREDVRTALGATFGTGGWVGSEADWIEGKLRQLEQWTRDPHPNIRRWAAELMADYRRRLDRARLLEEEDEA